MASRLRRRQRRHGRQAEQEPTPGPRARTREDGGGSARRLGVSRWSSHVSSGDDALDGAEEDQRPQRRADHHHAPPAAEHHRARADEQPSGATAAIATSAGVISALAALTKPSRPCAVSGMLAARRTIAASPPTRQHNDGKSGREHDGLHGAHTRRVTQRTNSRQHAISPFGLRSNSRAEGASHGTLGVGEGVPAGACRE